MDYEYKIVLGKKGRSVELIISFSEADFHHLAGLHKLRDRPEVATKERRQMLQRILSADPALSDLDKSDYFDEIRPRIEVLAHLETILDSDATVFRFLSSVAKGSQIKADWLLSSELKGKGVFLFLRHRKNTDENMGEGRLCCCSMFPKTVKDFTAGQPRYTVLKKEKHQLSTGETAIQCDRVISK